MRVVFFAPHAGIWVHAFPEALVADAVRASGAEVVYVTCGGALGSCCIPMASRGLTVASPERAKQAVCRGCRRERLWLRHGFRFDGYDFESMLTGDDERRVEGLVAQARPEDVAAFEVDGVQVGRLALYEYLIARKKSQLELTDAEWPEFRPRLSNALRSLLAAGKVLERERADRVVTYNSLYSVNAMWRAAADQRGIPSYFLHAGVGLERRLQTLIIGRDSTLRWYLRLIEAWSRYRDVPCSKHDLAVVTGHFEHLFRGTSVFAYSSAKASHDVRQRFGIRPDQKLVVATMSSYDEYIAAAAIGEMPAEAGTLFPTQIEWIHALVEWFRARPELFLVIRVHPREFPNKREGTKSDHAQRLERELADLPANVRVNWPADQLSIYDLAEYTDVFLNAWSSAGREMALLGIPVVAYCPELLLYPADLNYVGTTHAAYFAAIETALRDGWSFERVRKAYRWCVLELVHGVANIGDGYHFTEEPPRSLWQRGLRAALALPGVREPLDLVRRPRRLREQDRLAHAITSGRETLLDLHQKVDEAAETAALRAQLARLARALYPSERGAPAAGTLRQRLAAVVDS